MNRLKVLITGGAGFIGLHLTRFLLEKGYEVTLCDDLSRATLEDEEFIQISRNPSVTWFRRDLTVASAWENLGPYYDFVYHLAAINGTSHFYNRPAEVLRVNLQTTLNLVQWASEKRCGKIVFASSSEVYASLFELAHLPIPTNESVPVGVTDLYNPRFSYAGSKIAGELLLLHSDLHACIVRYHNIYGPRMGFEHVIPSFCVRILHKEDPFPIYGGKHRRAFCYVQDAIRATHAVMENDETNRQIVNIGNDEQEIAIVDLAERLFQVTGYHPKAVLEKEAPEGAVLRRCPDLSKIRKWIGFQPEITLNEGLLRTWEWYRTKERLQLRGVS